MTRVLTCDHNSLHFFICIYTWFCDFIEPKYRSQSCGNTRTVIYISAKKKVLIWLQVRILYFYHKLFPWAWMSSAYMSIVMFVRDDYKTCLKVINCITHVMIILEPCRNNNKFQAGMANFFVYVHMLHMVCCAHTFHTHFLIVVGKCRLTQFPQKQNKKSDWCWQIWLCDWATQLVKLQSFQGMLVTGVRFRFNKLVSSLIHCNQVLSHASLP